MEDIAEELTVINGEDAYFAITEAQKSAAGIGNESYLAKVEAEKQAKVMQNIYYHRLPLV